MGRLCVYVDFTRVFDVCGENCYGLCTFMWFHRCFRIIFLWNFVIFMFMWKHRGFWYVFKQFPTEFRLRLRRRCVPQGNSPPFCIVAFAWFSLPFSWFRCLFDITEVFDMFSKNFQPNFGWNYGADAFRREIDVHYAPLPPRHLLPAMYLCRRLCNFTAVFVIFSQHVFTILSRIFGSRAIRRENRLPFASGFAHVLSHEMRRCRCLCYITAVFGFVLPFQIPISSKFLGFRWGFRWFRILVFSRKSPQEHSILAMPCSAGKCAVFVLIFTDIFWLQPGGVWQSSLELHTP